MMHGYLAFDKNDNLLVPFRTWRNTTTKEASDKLTEAFNIFGEFAELMGYDADKTTLYEKLYRHAMTGESNGIVAYNYLSGEHVTEIEHGRPMYFRLPDMINFFC